MAQGSAAEQAEISIEAIRDFVRQGNAQTRKELARQLGDEGKQLLSEAFEDAAGDEYRELFFGDRNLEPTLERVNQWLEENVGLEMHDELKIKVVKAIMCFREQLDATLLYVGGNEPQECRLYAQARPNHTMRIRAVKPGGYPANVRSQVNMPALKMI